MTVTRELAENARSSEGADMVVPDWKNWRRAGIGERKGETKANGEKETRLCNGRING